MSAGDVAWVNGHLVERDRATVALDDPGLLVGHGVFETMRAEADGDGPPHALPHHLERLMRSAAITSVDLPFDPVDLEAAIATVLREHRRDPLPACGSFIRVRLTATAGGTVAITTTTTSEWPTTTNLGLIDAPVNEHDPLRGAKTISHLEHLWCRDEGRRLGFDEVVRTNTAGHLAECSSANLFLVRDGRILTPDLSTGCLPGVTREMVCELVEVDEVADLVPADLLRADEIFVTSATRGVHPVHAIDDRRLDAPGPVTARIRRAHLRATGRDPDA